MTEVFISGWLREQWYKSKEKKLLFEEWGERKDGAIILILDMLHLKPRWNSLAVQWLGLTAFTAAAKVQCLIRELRSCKPQHGQKKEKIKWNISLEI